MKYDVPRGTKIGRLTWLLGSDFWNNYFHLFSFRAIGFAETCALHKNRPSHISSFTFSAFSAVFAVSDRGLSVLRYSHLDIFLIYHFIFSVELRSSYQFGSRRICASFQKESYQTHRLQTVRSPDAGCLHKVGTSGRRASIFFYWPADNAGEQTSKLDFFADITATALIYRCTFRRKNFETGRNTSGIYAGAIFSCIFCVGWVGSPELVTLGVARDGEKWSTHSNFHLGTVWTVA